MWLIKTIERDRDGDRGFKYEVGYHIETPLHYNGTGPRIMEWYCYEAFRSHEDAEQLCHYLNGGNGGTYPFQRGEQIISSHHD